jgi:hypothetical protein
VGVRVREVVSVQHVLRAVDPLSLVHPGFIARIAVGVAFADALAVCLANRIGGDAAGSQTKLSDGIKEPLELRVTHPIRTFLPAYTGFGLHST